MIIPQTLEILNFWVFFWINNNLPLFHLPLPIWLAKTHFVTRYSFSGIDVCVNSVFHIISHPFGNARMVESKERMSSRKIEPAARMIEGSRLCVLRLAYLLTVIFSCVISTRTSVVHLGQYSGKLWTIVSSKTFVRVLLPQMGQWTHLASSCSLFMCDSFT